MKRTLRHRLYLWLAEKEIQSLERQYAEAMRNTVRLRMRLIVARAEHEEVSHER